MSPSSVTPPARTVRHFLRFTAGQRLEHLVVFVAFVVLLLTGLPQKYGGTAWSQQIISTPGQLQTLRAIHHVFAVLMVMECVYHLGQAVYLLVHRRLSIALFPGLQDFADAWQMFKYLLFVSPDKPRFGHYSYEQKFMYWLVVVALGILTISGLIIWFPVAVTWILPGAPWLSIRLATLTVSPQTS